MAADQTTIPRLMECITCGGDGEIERTDLSHPYVGSRACPSCGGKGGWEPGPCLAAVARRFGLDAYDLANLAAEVDGLGHGSRHDNGADLLRAMAKATNDAR